MKTFGVGESLERSVQIAETVNAVWGERPDYKYFRVICKNY